MAASDCEDGGEQSQVKLGLREAVNPSDVPNEGVSRMPRGSNLAAQAIRVPLESDVSVSAAVSLGRQRSTFRLSTSTIQYELTPVVEVVETTRAAFGAAPACG